MRKGLKNWKKKLQTPNFRKLWYSSGGSREYYIILGIFYFLLFSYNLLQMLLIGAGCLSVILYTAPFFIFSMILFSKLKIYADIVIDAALCLILISVEGSGRFSGAIFGVFVLFRLHNKKVSYIFMAAIIAGISISSIMHSRSIVSSFILIFVYSVIGFKYYYLILKKFNILKSQNISLKTENQLLKNKLSIFGVATQLTNDQILQKYPYMYYKETNPYRKINDIRLLASDKGHKEIAAINKISPQTQFREFSKLKKEFKIELQREKKIETLWGLIIAGIELGIIPVKYKQEPYSL